jgi:UDP-N-acetylglucosamine--N-acetylmuramyl-(pentapeptide) pyrophosphoryl-undecaprenol N-acetylglucosamine transferase
MTGGGTGGHIFPAIAIADSLKNRVSDSRILFIGAKGKMEERIVPANNYEIKSINISGLRRGKYLEWLAVPVKFFCSVRKCKRIIYEFKPSVVVATGGYVSAPVIYSALKKKCKIVLQEGNAIPGKVTKMFAGKADKVIVNFEETKQYLKRKDNILRIAYPIRILKENINRNEACEFFGISEKRKTLFVFGGSQGSASINNILEKIIPELYAMDLNIIWQTGMNDFRRIKDGFEKYSGRVKIFGFIDKMFAAYTASDLVICRAGVSSIMEIAALKKPAIIVPYPYAAENHQEKNAKALAKENACIFIPENQLEEKLFETVKTAIFDDGLLKKLSENVYSFSDSDSANKIADEIIKITS